MKPSVKYQVIFKHKDKYRISEMCRFFEVSRSGYYEYLHRKDIPDRDLPLANLIKDVYKRQAMDLSMQPFHYPQTEKSNRIKHLNKKRPPGYGGLFILQ